MIRLPRPLLASEIAALLGAPLIGEDRLLHTVAPLEEATEESLSFLQDNRKFNQIPGLLLTRQAASTPHLQVPDPLYALSGLLRRWFPEPASSWRQTSEGAWVEATAKLHPSVRLSPGVVVGAGSEVGEDTVLFPNVVLQHGVRVGRGCRLHAGTVLGSDGFRYHPTARGILKVPQVGGVWVGDEVEMGANCTIDRGFLTDTRIGDGCKFDNLVHIGHNCQIGKFVIIAAQSGLSGSCVVGDGVLMGGQVGLADRTEVGAGAKIGAQSGLHGKIPAGETWLGTPAQPIAVMRRVYGILPELPKIWRRFVREER